jgi:hypothetical protein
MVASAKRNGKGMEVILTLSGWMNREVQVSTGSMVDERQP